ncbi:hypothetical protein GV827_19755 [Sulfitobacter sp. JBTF-M27]|uniref:Virulence-associated protein E-like domain-containing protein n=2 Tax=Sulfitobacter sediminilitoris TaxID=2698830 RepID=A0A6P0CEK5_9RHOB|nr:hypothetical protein [Sulfitobacter sediminilitoris]
MAKSEANDAKAFMSRQQDDVRMVYDRSRTSFPRQCVIWGTTNDKEYLRDATGGRRYLIVEMTAEQIDTDRIERDRDAIWQAAALGYDEMRAEQPYGTLPLFLQGEAAETAKQMQERARKSEAWEGWMETIIEWLDEGLTLQELFNRQERDTEKLLDGDDTFHGVPLTAMVCRVAFSQQDAMRKALGMNANAPITAQAEQFWSKVVSKMKEQGWIHGKGKENVPATRNRATIGGKQKMWMIRPDITDEERKRGFRVCNPAQAPESGSTQVADDDDYDDLL